MIFNLSLLTISTKSFLRLKHTKLYKIREYHCLNSVNTTKNCKIPYSCKSLVKSTPFKCSCVALTAVISLKCLFYKNVFCEALRKEHIRKKTNFEWKKLLHLVSVDVWRWLGAVIAALIVAYINIKIPLCLGNFANIVTNIVKDSHSIISEEIRHATFKLVSLYLLQAIGTFVYISLLFDVGENLATRVKNDLYMKILNQDIAFYDEKRTGELLDCLFSDVQEFKSSFKHCVSQGLKNCVQVCGCVISLFTISPIMTFTLLTVVPSIILAGSLVGTLLRKLSNAAQEQSMKTLTMSEEILSNIRTVRSFANEPFECEKFKKEAEEAQRLNIQLGHGIAIFQAGTNLFLNGLVLGTLYFGSTLMLNDQMSPGSLMSFLVTAQMIQKSFAQLSLTFGHFIKGKQAFERISYYSELKSIIPIKGGKKISHHSLKPTLELKNIMFSYPTRPDQVVLDNLSLTLPAGKTVAIVGASGNGKSTIAALIERFYDVNSGAVMLDGVDIRTLDASWLRGSVVGFIGQEPVLFAGSIKDNIKYGKPDASDDEMYEAAKQANADTFIRTFPDGYDTLVGERGVNISGGQKQRIAIARALIKKPAILILDEATSALDVESEKIVQNTFDKVSKQKTVLIIAHRLSTVKNADIIAVLNKGVIVEMGDHSTLLKKKGLYYSLMNQEKLQPERNYG